MKIIIRSDHVHIEGYVNAVERLSKPITERHPITSKLVTFMERVKAGTFKKALQSAPDVRILLNHKEERDLGGIKDGNLKLEEDSIGLRAEADIYDSEVIKDAKAGKLVGWSFGFYPLNHRETSEDGMPIRELSEIDLREVSILNKNHTPAYDGTLVCVRDLSDEKMLIADSFISEDIEIREEADSESQQAQEEPEPIKEVSSEYYARYKTMIALMKA